MKSSNHLLAIFCLAMISNGFGGSACADDLVVFGTVAMKPALVKLVPMFENVAHTKVALTYTGGSDLKNRAEAGEQFDVLIGLKPATEGLIKSGIVLSEPKTQVGTALPHLAIKTASASPDISNDAALKAVLLSAPSISVSDPVLGGASSTYFMAVVKRLGIEESVMSKLLKTKTGEGAVPVGAGIAPLGIALTSEIAGVPGVSGTSICGSDDSCKIVVYATIASHAQHADLGLKFIDFLASPEAIAVRKETGLAGE